MHFDTIIINANNKKVYRHKGTLENFLKRLKTRPTIVSVLYKSKNILVRNNTTKQNSLITVSVKHLQQSDHCNTLLVQVS